MEGREQLYASLAERGGKMKTRVRKNRAVSCRGGKNNLDSGAQQIGLRRTFMCRGGRGQRESRVSRVELKV